MKDSIKVISMLVLIIVSVIGTILFPYLTSDTVSITITEKERIVKQDSSKYLVFTETETFENSDCLVRFKFNSSDLYGKMKKDESYDVLVYGWRIPFLSMYRNIVKIIK